MEFGLGEGVGEGAVACVPAESRGSVAGNFTRNPLHLEKAASLLGQKGIPLVGVHDLSHCLWDQNCQAFRL